MADAGPVVTLSVVEGPGCGAQYRYEERATAIVGRADDCNPRVDEPGSKQLVSRHHCLFDINPPDIRVRDFGSLNGTHVNGDEIGRRSPGQSPEEAARLIFRERDLTDGDRIKLGNTVIQIGITVPPPPTITGTVCQTDRGKAIGVLLDNLVADDSPPQIPDHELVKKIGDGGQGVVYLARQQPSGDLVAVKMLLPKVAVKERSRAMFEREIANVAALDHPHIVSFRESGRIGAAWYFTSEYCAGGSVDDLVDRGLLAPGQAVPIVVQALDGLAYAHTAPLPNGSIGLVHRDIKPGNILLARRGGDLVAKVADFGLSKAFDRAGLSGMTLTGSVAGTMPFMARPQLIDYKHALPDVDVWSMAASLYWMLTGYYPRDFPEREDPIRVVLDTNAVPIRERDPNIPHRLATVIDEALIDRPKITVGSAAQLAAALREAIYPVAIIDYAGLSDIGCERSSNQDRWGADPEVGLLVVADGVAGSSDGELAAQVIAELLPTYLRRHLDSKAEPAQLGRAVAELSNDLYLMGQTDPRVAGATSTVVAVVVAGSRALVAHLGDSRVYLYRDQQLKQLTRDHSLVQALIDSHEIKPEDAAQHPARNVVTRYVGMPPPAIPDAADVELQDGDRILLCSDGLFGVVDDAAIAGIVGDENVPTDACEALIAAARQAGGPDNITAVVVHVSCQ